MSSCICFCNWNFVSKELKIFTWLNLPVPPGIKRTNNATVTTKKIAGVPLLVAEISSKSYKPSGLSQIITIVLKNDGSITLNIPILNEINVCVIMKVLGLVTDKDIINYIVHDVNDHDMINLVIKSINLFLNI